MMSWPHIETTPLGEIVSRDFRAGAILDRYGLDYCCGGTRTLAEGCQTRGISVERVVSELEALDPASRETPEQDPTALIKHIISRHHSYVRESMPIIQQHLAKVSAAHGARHPELPFVEARFSNLAAEMSLHMVKEEQVLFPYILALVDASSHGAPPPPDMFGTVQNPIRMMEMEHQEAGEGLDAIREMTHGYRAPDDACGTYRLVLQELEAFEKDLHVHVHLENNVLFPRAVELEEKTELLSRGLKCGREGE
jgi:regulator of cell morphogenesis and NO signaling